MPKDQNGPDGLLDAILEDALAGFRLAAGLSKTVLAMLKELERDLRASIIEQGVRARRERQTLQRMLRETRALISGAYERIVKEVGSVLNRFGKVEAQNAQAAINVLLGVDAKKLGVPSVTLQALAESVAIEGHPASKWWENQAKKTRKKFDQVVKGGVIQAKTTDVIVAEVRKDVLDTSRREAEALVRTSTQAVANEARQKTYEANTDLIKGYLHLSTLDGRTSRICIARSGLEWDAAYNPLGHDKEFERPPIHFNCRSVILPILRSFAELAGEDEASAGSAEAERERLFREILRRKLEKQGLTERQIANELAGKRAAMNGQAPRTTTFSDWLKSKPKAFQDKLLGKKRAELWRTGKIQLEQLTDAKDRPLTIEQLEALARK